MSTYTSCGLCSYVPFLRATEATKNDVDGPRPRGRALRITNAGLGSSRLDRSSAPLDAAEEPCRSRPPRNATGDIADAAWVDVNAALGLLERKRRAALRRAVLIFHADLMLARELEETASGGGGS